MALLVFPSSPLPADMGREIMWGDHTTRYDSGAFQGSTPYVKPLLRYTINFGNWPVSKQSSLFYFYNQVRGPTTPFLFQDPYESRANNVVSVNTGTAPTSFWLLTPQGFPVIAKSGSLRITSALSGALTAGSHYVLNQDTGLIVASMRPSSADYWTSSCEYFRKVHFVSYGESSKLWNQFSGSIVIEELALP